MAEKLRVVHVIPTLAKGGAERIAIDICNQLQKNAAIDVKIVVFSDLNTFPTLSKNLDVRVIPTRYVPSILRKPIDETQGLSAFFDEFKPHIIHTHLFEAEIAARATGYYNAAFVTHCHDNMPQLEDLGRRRFTSKQLYGKAYERSCVLKHAAKAKGNVFLAISDYTKRYFEKNLPPTFKNNVVLLPNAIDYQKFASRPLPTYPTGRFKLINVGSFFPRKNQKLLIDIMHILGNQSAAVDLVMLGDGPDRAKILEEISKNALELTTTAPGNVENVEEYLANAHVYVHTAVHEPFGLVIAEALAAGLPVVALDAFGNRDLHKEGETGYLIEYDSAILFADKIGKLVSDKKLYESLTHTARAFAKQFDIVPYTDKLTAIYKQLAA